jgi:hypothetical protein
LFATHFFKSGLQKDVANYQRIAVLAAILKFFELLVYRGIYITTWTDLHGLPPCEDRCVLIQIDTLSKRRTVGGLYYVCILNSVGKSVFI